MTNTPKRGGWVNPSSAANGKAGGRPPAKISIKLDSTVMVQHRPAGEYAPLVLGRVVELRRNFARIELSDGTEVVLML